MITTETKTDVQRYGGDTDEGKFLIRANGKSFKALIADMYPNKVLAVIRELSQNAADSHLLAGNAHNPFEITLPTEFEPNFIIRDFGIGIPKSFMLGEYIQVFFSSKDKTNDLAGGFGVGRVAPLSLCDSYICESYIDGTKSIYSIFYDETGIPTRLFLGEEPTTEPNGFLVNVPVNPNKVNEFERMAAEAYRYYKVKPVIKNRDNFEIPKDEYIILSEEHLFGLRGAGHSSMAIMAGYAYPIDKQSIIELTDIQSKLLSSGLVVHFKSGEIDPILNRESLDYNEKTIKNIKTKLDTIIPVIKPLVLTQFEGKNVFEKCSLQYDLTNYNGKLAAVSELVKQFIYDLKIPSQFSFDGCEVFSFKREFSRGAERMKKSEGITIEYRPNVVLYFADKKSHLQLKANKFLDDNLNWNKRIVFIYENEPDAFQKFQTKYGFDLNTLPKASTLPFDKPIAGEREFNVMKFLGKTTRYNRTDANCWLADSTFNPDSEVVYVERFGYQVTGNAVIGYDNINLTKNIHKFNEITGKTQVVYGLTPRQVKNKKSHWKTFAEVYQAAIDDYNKNQVEKIAAWKYFNSNYCEFPCDLIKILNVDPQSVCGKIKEEYFKIKELIKDVNSELANKSNTEIANCFSFTTEQLKDKYPILFLVSYWVADDNKVKQHLEDYIVLQS